jgi:hypothetical protein
VRKRLILITLIFSFVSYTVGQTDDVPLPKSLRSHQPRDWEKKKIDMMVGGNFGAQFGSYTAVSVTPMFGIYPTNWLLVGVGGTYMFSHDKYYDLSFNVFGANAFVEGLIWKRRIIAHVSYEYVNYDTFYLIQGVAGVQKERINSHAILLGPGYRQEFSDSFSAFFLLLFDVVQNSRSFYSNPVFRVGITYDF